MERKIGEIFEYNGEWYQCVKSPDGSCKHCDMNFGGKCPIPTKECMAILRNDLSYVIFKKLEKVGKPYEYGGHIFQEYHIFEKPIFTENYATIREFGVNSKLSIEIKQNKEDMEEGKLDTHMEKVIDEAAQKLGDEISKQLIENLNKQRMKPFNLEDAKAGRPVCTRDGRKARIICFDAKSPKTGNIVTLVEKENGEEVTLFHYDDGHCSIGRAYALMMLPEKKEGWAKIRKDINLYDTKEEADRKMIGNDEYVTAKVCWEE